MAATGGFPKWLLEGKEHITKGGEWSNFIEELYDAIQQQLKESHVQSFTDLTDAERTLFMERATKAINGGKAYKDLYKRVGVSLDQHLNNEVAKQLMEDYPINTKTDLILDAAQEGAVSILKKWPDMKSKLHICFNQPLPKPIRQLAWRLFLENTKLRKKYIDMMQSNVRACVSPLDLQISQKCEQLILSEPTFEDLKGSIGAFYGMKAVLSYHHALKKTKTNLPDMDYLLMVPFVVNALPNLSRKEPAASHVVTLLVEEYLSFMEGRPGFVIDSGSEIHEEEMKVFCGKVSKHLLDNSPDVAKTVSKAFVPNKEKIVATDTGSKEILSDGVKAIARPVIRSMFVGFCNMEVVQFIWDQYMISLDVGGFHDEYLPAITAIFLTLLKDAIVKCKAPEDFDTIKTESVKLTVPQFQYEMNKSYYKTLFPKLKSDDKAALPVLDPTQANYPPWINWFSDKIPNRTTPAERRKAREEREAEKQRLLQQQREEERLNREHEERERRDEEQRLFEQQIQDKQRHEEERIQLEDELDVEKRKRLDAERVAAAQIEDLKKEIEELRQIKAKEQRPPTGFSLSSSVDRYLIPPPNTAASGYPRTPATPLRMSKLASPPPSLSPDKQAKSVVTDFLKRVSQSYNKIAHGDGYLKEQLDEDTQQKILVHRDDVKQAEVAVFGRQLGPGEWDQMPLEERQQRADEIMDQIRETMQERRQEELAAGTANPSFR